MRLARWKEGSAASRECRNLARTQTCAFNKDRWLIRKSWELDSWMRMWQGESTAKVGNRVTGSVRVGIKNEICGDEAQKSQKRVLGSRERFSDRKRRDYVQ